MSRSPGIHFLEVPHGELPPPKTSATLPASLHQVFCVSHNPVHVPSCIEWEGAKSTLNRVGFSPCPGPMMSIPQSWPVLAQVAVGTPQCDARGWQPSLRWDQWYLNPVGLSPSFLPTCLVSQRDPDHLESPQVNGVPPCLSAHTWYIYSSDCFRWHVAVTEGLTEEWWAPPPFTEVSVYSLYESNAGRTWGCWSSLKSLLWNKSVLLPVLHLLDFSLFLCNRRICFMWGGKGEGGKTRKKMIHRM